MDLLACSQCGSRFYVPGIGPSESRCCSQCGAGLDLALHGMTSIPLDARWLDPRVEHFYLPTADSQGPPRDLQRPPSRLRGHLRLVASNGNRFQSEEPA